MGDFFKDYMWLLLAAVLGIVVYVLVLVRKYRPLYKLAKQNSDMEKKYKTLTEELILSVPDSELMTAVRFNIWSRMDEKMDNEYEVVSALTMPQKYVYTTALLRDKMCDGGFELACITGAANFCETARDGYYAVGAEQCGLAMEKAADIYNAHIDELRGRRHFSEDDEAYFEQPDEMFLDAVKQESLEECCAKYIKANVSFFIG